MWGTGHQLVTVAQGYLLFELTGSTLWLAALGAAVGVPNSQGLKLLICLMGVATSGLWASRVWYWAGLSVMDRRTALGLAGLYALAWVFTLLIQLTNMVSPGYRR